MSKRDKHFEKVQEYKDRFRLMSLESLRERANSPSLFKEAAIALRELIAERESAASHQERSTCCLFTWNYWYKCRDTYFSCKSRWRCSKYGPGNANQLL